MSRLLHDGEAQLGPVLNSHRRPSCAALVFVADGGRPYNRQRYSAVEVGKKNADAGIDLKIPQRIEEAVACVVREAEGSLRRAYNKSWVAPR